MVDGESKKKKKKTKIKRRCETQLTAPLFVEYRGCASHFTLSKPKQMPMPYKATLHFTKSTGGISVF